VWGTNGPRSLAGDGYETLPGFVQANPPRSNVREHITQKPVEIMRPLTRIAPAGGVILDPFCGAGSTGVAALHEGRRFVGIEQAAHFCAVTARRVEAAGLAVPSDGDFQGRLELAPGDAPA
jgi:site-specific DNA-methyltransferase (adenine-specific)